MVVPRFLQRRIWSDELSILTFVPSSVVVLIITAYMILAWYLWQRHVFKGPRLGLQVIEQYSSQVASLQNESVAYSLVGGNSNEAIMKERKAD
jgi:choline transport protein